MLGTVPGTWEDLDAGEYPVRVAKDGFHSFETTVTIRGGRTRSLAATLAEMLGSIVVESDIAGANVFIDRNFKGNTPVTIADLQPGEYNLTVSTEGHDIVSRRVAVERRAVPVRVVFGDLVASLDVKVAVVHKHRFGSCEGMLVATPQGFDYRTDHKDAFQLPFAQAERFELDYLSNNMRMKVLGGANLQLRIAVGGHGFAIRLPSRRVGVSRAGVMSAVLRDDAAHDRRYLT